MTASRRHHPSGARHTDDAHNQAWPVAARRVYRAPRVQRAGSIDELLELLGPAQANYADAGLP